MPTKKPKAKSISAGTVNEMTRSERLLALLLLNQADGASQAKRAILLRRGGFSNTQIAELLETTAAVVSQVLYSARKTRAANPKGRKK